MWIDEVESEEKTILFLLAGLLNMPSPDQYTSKVDFLRDVYSDIRDAKDAVRQLNDYLGVYKQ